MKAAIYVVHYGLGGSTIALIPYVQVLIERGYEVCVVCQQNDLGSRILQEHGATIIIQPFPFGLNVTAMESFYSTYEKILKLFKDIIKFTLGFVFTIYISIKIKPDLAIVGDFTLLQIILASKLLRIKTITIIQTSFSQLKLQRSIIRKIVRLSDEVVGITEMHVRQIIIGSEDNLKYRCFVIRNTVIPTECDKSLFDEFYHLLNITTPHIVLFVGGCNKIKGSLEFVNIAVDILSHRDDVTFILAGPFNKYFKTEYAVGTSGIDFKLTQEILRLKSLQDRWGKIKIIGETKYIVPLLENSSFLLAPSSYPHFLRPVIEGWSVKKPSIVTDDIFTRIMIKDGEDGFLVNKGDHAGFVHRCNLLFNDTRLCYKLGENGYQTYRRLYEQTVAIRDIKNLLSVTEGG